MSWADDVDVEILGITMPASAADGDPTPNVGDTVDGTGVGASLPSFAPFGFYGGPCAPAASGGKSARAIVMTLGPERIIIGAADGRQLSRAATPPASADRLILSDCDARLELRQSGGWTYGVLANHLWSYAGNEERNQVRATFVQPFLSYITKTKTTFGINTEASYDWNNTQWSVPVNVSISQLFKIGNAPMQFSIGGRYYAVGPNGGPEWGLRAVLTLLFPK